MDLREKDLMELKSYTEEIDKDLTMILQTLQWDRQHLLQGNPLVKCKYDTGHRIPEEIKEKHELECFLKNHGYNEDDLLPEPLDSNASTLVKLGKTDLYNIINIAAASDPLFRRRGVGWQEPQPLTLGRLQSAYSVDERRAIHNAVVSKAPATQETFDLTLPGSEDPQPSKETKSKLELLSQIRDMKRRPVKYRVASKTRNYSDVLRGVIKSQMEMYTGVKTEPTSTKQEPGTSYPMKIKQEYSPSRENNEDNSNYHEADRTVPDREIKREPRYEHRHGLREIKTEDRNSRSKYESDDRRDRYNHRDIREYPKNKHDHSDRRRHKERERSPSREKSRRTTDDYKWHDTERRRHEDKCSRDRRTDNRHRDKYKSSGSHNYTDVKIKEEKRSRYYESYDDYDDRRRH